MSSTRRRGSLEGREDPLTEKGGTEPQQQKGKDFHDPREGQEYSTLALYQESVTRGERWEEPLPTPWSLEAGWNFQEEAPAMGGNFSRGELRAPGLGIQDDYDKTKSRNKFIIARETLSNRSQKK